MSRTAAFAAMAVYLLVPGATAAYLTGVPLGLWGSAALALVVFAGLFFREQPSTINWTRTAMIFAALAVMKAAAAGVSMPIGWRGWYYASADFSGRVMRSTEFTSLDATRVDRTIDFRDDYFPVHFLNEAGFNRGIRREVTEPVTTRWVGHVHPSSAQSVSLELVVRGSATVSRDGQVVMRASTQTGAVSRTVTVGPGEHAWTVEYLKPASTDPLISLRRTNASNPSADLIVTPEPVRPWRRSVFRIVTVVARVLDAVSILLFVWILGRLARGRQWRVAEPETMAAAMFVFFAVQGVVSASPFQHRAVSLSGGDDWLAYEARAREVETGGPLMRFGQPLFGGETFYYYPGYSYFLAGVHQFTGEDLSGPIFSHFLLLFLTNVLVYRTAVRLFDRRIAVGAVAMLVGVEELAFIRHYTVILLSENLYFATVSWTVASLVRFISEGRRVILVSAGVAAGVSSLVRPVMMLYLLPAVAMVVIAAYRHRLRRGAVVTAAVLFVSSWLAVTSLATIRNYLVAGQPVFIVVTPASQFVFDNLPPANGHDYMLQYQNGLGSAARVLFRIAVENPYATIRGWLTKIGFSLGWLQLMGGNAHPELVAMSAGYLIALLLLQQARAFITWPVHAFVIAHLSGLVLRMPSLYGYRLILPLYLFFPMFASAVLASASRAMALPRARPA